MSINKSLSCLADVVAARANKKPHVPYRNSTLTYVLQDSLEGDCKTVMIAQISPAETNSDESYSTLNFANRVRKVELGQVRKCMSVLYFKLKLIPNPNSIHQATKHKC